MSKNMIAEMPNGSVIKAKQPTVIDCYIPSKNNATHYQSEAEMENDFIRQLINNGYERLTIHKNEDLIQNLKTQLQRLNDIHFSEHEWQQLFHNYLANKNDGIEDKTKKIQEDYIYDLTRDDGSTKNIRIIDKQNIHNNHLQVINQYETEGARKNRYDVTVLVNGLPLLHIELKRRGMSIREAFNQINRYQRESFWADDGLFQFIQLFVISNGTETKYYSNSTRDAHIKEQKGKTTSKKTSNSFEFTSWWADGKNERIMDIVDFSKTFFAKHSLLSIIIKYCVFTSDKNLLVMRPYQIVAAERIMNRIEMATNHKQLGTLQAGGYIWHTTGSGKTLTSFKTALLASQYDGVDKVIFVVDRKDLDYQTMKEYDKFQKGAANSNSNTKVLTEQLGNKNTKIIITTIQKLSKFISSHKSHPIYQKHVVLIFDECHRSQFGTMHTAITKNFKKYHLFGFTGTPIFKENAKTGMEAGAKTTEQAFGEKLHSYTIVNAIQDGNVLHFKLDCINTIKQKDHIKDKKIKAIDTNAAANAPERISLITDYILTHFDQKTKRDGGTYSFQKISNVSDMITKKVDADYKPVRQKGFNSIFAVSSIEVAKKYYLEFKKRQSPLKIALIYSFGANEEEPELGYEQNEDGHLGGFLTEENFETDALEQSSRDFLDMVIQDYNDHFDTNYDSSSEKFGNYYKDISHRMKNREIDMLIVVNMFLTGFDATTLNCLWVDKNLRYHGLLQAFSRTNRILNSVKSFGHIVSFRDLEEETNEALRLFGDEEHGGIALIKTLNQYLKGWTEDGIQHQGFEEMIALLKRDFPVPVNLIGEAQENEFVRLWGKILRMRNILVSFDDFVADDLLSERDWQDYTGVYEGIRSARKALSEAERENINGDIEFELELVKQITVNIDYILYLIGKYQETDKTNQGLYEDISRQINASYELRSKKDLIEGFINGLNSQSDVDHDWPEYVKKKRQEELNTIIAEEKLNSKKALKFIDNAFRDGELRITGTDFADILPPLPLFDKENLRQKTKIKIGNRLNQFFEKYLGV